MNAALPGEKENERNKVGIVSAPTKHLTTKGNPHVEQCEKRRERTLGPGAKLKQQQLYLQASYLLGCALQTNGKSNAHTSV